MLKKEGRPLKKTEKTNAVRYLEQMGIPFILHSFTTVQACSALKVAQILGQDVQTVFKTLVTVGKTGTHYVFIVPAAQELDLKKAAISVCEKSVEMLKAKDLFPLTGYVHGGCSPIGMKKFFKTVVDESARLKKTIFVSGGRIGLQIEIGIDELAIAIPLSFACLCKSV